LSELWEMKLRTEITINKKHRSICHQSPILLMGSCFSENIGSKLNEHKFNALINPLGIAYNPISLHTLIVTDSANFTKQIKGLQESNELYFHFNFHSTFNALSKRKYIEKLNEAIEKKEQFIQQKPTLILTYGTAWAHELKSSDQIVNNCHKLPASNFNKRLLKVEEIVYSWEKMKLDVEKRYKHSFNFIFTLSPVRHSKDGFIENQQSKSTLNLAIHQICAEHPNCSYFPAYEVMMDDLRDYRFYKTDLLHPNEMAVNYIWDLFSIAYFSEETQDFNQQIKQFTQSLNHRAFNYQSKEHQTFIVQLIESIERFAEESKIDFSTEINKLKEQLLT